MSVGEFVSLLFLLICRPTNCVCAEKIFVIQLFFKEFVSSFLNFLGVLVYLGPTLLNGCFQDVANAQTKSLVWKFVQRKATYFCLFLGKSFLHHVFFFFSFLFFFFDFVKLGISPLLLKIILNILLLFLFNFKTQIFLYILINDSVTDFFKCFICTFYIFCYISLIVLIALRQK